MRFVAMLAASLLAFAMPGGPDLTREPRCGADGCLPAGDTLVPRGDGSYLAFHALVSEREGLAEDLAGPPVPEAHICVSGAKGDFVPYPYPCAPKAPLCVDDPDADPHWQVLYGRPSTAPDLYAERHAGIQSMVAVVTGLFHAEAAPHGYTADLVVLCDGGGDVAVANETVDLAPGQDLFAAVAALGYAEAHVKYLVVWEGTLPCGGCVGVATIFNDDSAGPENQHNLAATYAAVETADRLQPLDAAVAIHEMGHAMGAVQLSAPHNNAGYHCRGGQDLMCYPYSQGGASSVRADLGKPGTLPAKCPDRERFDCDNDDYFHPDPPAGSYLATHWNLGSADNLFLRVRPA